MQHDRKTLTIRRARRAPEVGGVESLELIRDAIGRGSCVSAVYNRTDMILAPHVLYTRHDDPFLDAVVAERAGLPPREVKMSTFKLAGLTSVKLLAKPVFPRLPIDLLDPKYAGSTIASLDGAFADSQGTRP